MPTLRADASRIGISTALILIPLILVPLVFAADKTAEQAAVPPVIITTAKTDLPDQAILIGVWSEKISDPKCVDVESLIYVTAGYKEIEKQKLKPGTGKYWILMSMASTTVKQAIVDYATESKTQFICKREKLFEILRKLPEFKDKKDAELIKQFDVTAAVADFALAKNKREENETKEKAKK